MQRRNFLKQLGTFSALLIATPLMAEYWDIDNYWQINWSEKHPNDFSIEKALSDITEGRHLFSSKKIVLSAPQLAEEGAIVPIQVRVDSPMSEDNYVKNIYILSEKSNSRVLYVELTPTNGQAYLATKIKLKSYGKNKVMAVAKLSDGRYIKASKNINVAVGGGEC